MTTTQTALSDLLKTHFLRLEPLPPDEWVEKYVRLSHTQTTHQGRYSLKRTPFFRRLYQDIANPAIKSIALMKSAQIGASLFASNCILYYVCNKTVPVGMVFPSQAMAQQFAERNLHPCLETTKPIQEFLTGDGNDIRRAELIFKSCTVKIIGGGSATKLSSNPIAFLIIDEASKFESFNSEADPIELATDRTLSFQETGEAKILITSTPSLEHSCQVTRHFKEGSQSHYYVPCPHCETFQTLEFENVRFNHCKRNDEWDLNAVLHDTFYECPHCHSSIDEEHKPDILNRGEWRDHNPDAPADLRSYTISALYSLSLTFGAIARMFLSAKGDRSRLQNFHNSILGKPWTPTAATVTEAAIDKIVERSPVYIRGEIPGKAKALILSADTQQAELPYMVTALLEDGGTAVIDYGIAVSFEDLGGVLNSQYKIKGSNTLMGIYGGIIDAGGNRTSQVYDACLGFANRLIPSFGRGDKHKQFTPIRPSTMVYKGFNLPFLNVHDKHFTDLLLLSVFKFGSETLFLPRDTEQILKDQLTAVSIVEKKDAKGFLTYEYVSRRDNHLFDCLKLAYALRYYLLPTLEAVEETPAPEEDGEPVGVSSGWDGGGWN